MYVILASPFSLARSSKEVENDGGRMYITGQGFEFQNVKLLPNSWESKDNLSEFEIFFNDKEKEDEKREGKGEEQGQRGRKR